MSATAIRPKRGFPEDAMYCGRCDVVWPRGYPVGGGVACPMPRPTPAPDSEVFRLLPSLDGRCAGTLVPAEEAYYAEQESE